ncbi:immunoglobulin superfamily member 6 isoform X2 [Ambystoma mexicanum]|uniref:immunoglobulin superfamily member 6 isoform X2 n=1 Tax=Ambystoma mexicanum TaxID=8296 RepID=UPI0037E7A9BC
MVLLFLKPTFFFKLLLTPLYAAVLIDCCIINEVIQNPMMEVEAISTGATLYCNFTATACTGEAEAYWFRYLEFKHEGLCTPGCAKNQTKYAQTTLTSRKSSLLIIQALHANDSGIYICGIAIKNSNAITSRRMGQGTTLVVTGRQPISINRGRVLLIVLTVLLFLYCVALICIWFFLCKYKAKEVLLSTEETTQEDSNGSHTRRVFFQAITQELYDKRRAKKNHNLVIYQNTT